MARIRTHHATATGSPSNVEPEAAFENRGETFLKSAFLPVIGMCQAGLSITGKKEGCAPERERLEKVPRRGQRREQMSNRIPGHSVSHLGIPGTSINHTGSGQAPSGCSAVRDGAML